MTFQAYLHPRWRPATQTVKKLLLSEQDRAAPLGRGNRRASFWSLPRMRFQHELWKAIKAFSLRHICRESNGMSASIPWLSEFSGILTSQVLLVPIKSILPPFLEAFQKASRSRKVKCSGLSRLELLLLSPGALLGSEP